jgi:hypothetical protein
MRRGVWVVFILLGACGGGTSGTGKCIPGDSKSCTGPGACSGYQVCRADGTYDPCNCGSGAGGMSGAGGTGGGTAGTGGSVGGMAGSSGAGGTGGALTCRNDRDAAANGYEAYARRFARAWCEWYVMCGAQFDGGTDCQAYEEQNWMSRASYWADNCDSCPYGISESRFTGICLGVIHDTPCSSMHGLTTVTAADCALFTICALVAPEDAGGQ